MLSVLMTKGTESSCVALRWTPLMVDRGLLDLELSRTHTMFPCIFYKRLIGSRCERRSSNPPPSRWLDSCFPSVDMNSVKGWESAMVFGTNF